MMINLLLNFIIISKLIIIINRCQYLAVSVFLMAEMNDPNFLNYYIVGFFLTTGRKNNNNTERQSVFWTKQEFSHSYYKYLLSILSSGLKKDK